MGFGVSEYEANRNLLASIQTKFSTATRSNFAYTHDTLGRRDSLTQTGDIFASYNGGGLSTAWGYNDRSEVTSSQTKFLGTNTAVLGRNFGYTYDPIGNRVTSSLDGATSTYTPNSLNQYTQRTVPGQVVTTGLAPANAAVDVNSSATTRQGEYYYKALFVTNTTSAAWTTLTTVSNLGGTDTRSSFVPQTPEAYTYDNDGNITSDGRWTYEWDAENRLTAMETRSAAYTVGTPRQRLEFKYDYLGRRVQKRVLNWSAPGWSLVSERRFIYDGWNLMAQFETSSGYVLKGRYVWGIDLSGNLQDAGGVGGLLSVYSAELNVEASPAYDGNGNIYGLVDRTSGVLRATYEYSPYGETLRSAGELADKNPFRFSSKFTDNETQMVYYGFRYYSPSLGRFYGRDPIEEKGGLHLYAFVENQVLNKWDLLGKLSNGKPKQSIVGAVFSWIGRTLGTVFGGRSNVSQSLSSTQQAANNNRVTGPFAEETVHMNVFNVTDRPVKDLDRPVSININVPATPVNPVSGIAIGRFGDDISLLEGEKKEAPNKPEEKEKSPCEKMVDDVVNNRLPDPSVAPNSDWGKAGVALVDFAQSVRNGSAGYGPTDGFRPEFQGPGNEVSPGFGYNNGVERHLIANLGAGIMEDFGGRWYAPSSDRSYNWYSRVVGYNGWQLHFGQKFNDWWQSRSGSLQKKAESVYERAANSAGYAAASDVHKYANGSISKEELRSSLLKQFCK